MRHAALKQLGLALVPALALAAGTSYFTLSAAFDGKAKAVAVTFTPRDPDVKINQEPAPRLKLDAGQKVLVDKQPPPPSRVQPFDPDTARYLDPKAPVLFPVAVAPGAPKGSQVVKATVTYFFCSKREGWCRKGMEEVEVPLTVP